MQSSCYFLPLDLQSQILSIADPTWIKSICLSRFHKEYFWKRYLDGIKHHPIFRSKYEKIVLEEFSPQCEASDWDVILQKSTKGIYYIHYFSVRHMDMPSHISVKVTQLDDKVTYESCSGSITIPPLVRTDYVSVKTTYEILKKRYISLDIKDPIILAKKDTKTAIEKILETVPIYVMIIYFRIMFFKLGLSGILSDKIKLKGKDAKISDLSTTIAAIASSGGPFPLRSYYRLSECTQIMLQFCDILVDILFDYTDKL